MKRVKASKNVRVQWLLMGLFSLSLTSCSLQKRTTMPGWHWEHEKTTFHQGPISSAEICLKDRGSLVNLPSRGASLQSEVDLSKSLQGSTQASSPKRDVEAMTKISVSELDETNQPLVVVALSSFSG